MDLKLIMNQIRSSIPKSKVEIETFITTELVRVMSCVRNESCKAELFNLQESLLDQLHTQQGSLEDVTIKLQNGLSTIQDSLEEIHTKMNTFSQSIVEFNMEMVSQLYSIKKEDIDRVLTSLKFTKTQIETLQKKSKLKNKDVM